MKEIDLSVYFEPCAYMEAGTFYDDDTLRLGRAVRKYTVSEQFPSVQDADVALIGLSESRGGKSDGTLSEQDIYRCNGADAVRRELYNLYPAPSLGKIVDLGNLRCGKRTEDTFFALTEAISCLLGQNTAVVLLGGTQDLTYAAYKAYAGMHRMANILSIDSRLNLAEGLSPDDNPLTAPLKNDSYMARIVVEPDNYLFNYMNLGYQTYLVDNEAVSLMGKLFFDACRYGMLRENLLEAEPYIRDADCVSFDMSAVKRTESPGNPWARPTGFTAEQACQLARYAGLSKTVNVFGIFEYYPYWDKEGLSAQLIAEMIWCFIDAMQHRCDDHPLTSKSMEYKQYTVTLDEVDKDLVFHKCKQTDRWWMELPCTEEQKQRYGRLCFLPCSYGDYQTAMQNEIPSRWWGAIQRLK